MKTYSIIIHILLLFCIFFKLGATSPNWHTASDGNSYLIEGESKYNWLQANDECSRRGLQLVIIDNAAKNKALIALLRNVFGKSRDLWLGCHDEFNTKKVSNRQFYTLATGAKLPFTYWKPGEPNNSGYNEHCAHIYQSTDFQWNDQTCTVPFGYICEDHVHTVKYRKDLQAKSKTVEQKNAQISKEYKGTQSEINRVGENTRKVTDSVLLDLQNDTDEILGDFKKSIWEIISKKPYMEAVIADLGDSINQVVAETEDELHKASQEARKTVEKVHLNAESLTKDITNTFGKKLETNANEVNKLLML